jgi:hypothetical protein
MTVGASTDGKLAAKEAVPTARTVTAPMPSDRLVASGRRLMRHLESARAPIFAIVSPWNRPANRSRTASHSRVS